MKAGRFFMMGTRSANAANIVTPLLVSPVAFFFFAVGWPLVAAAQSPPSPPVAREIEHRETWHGETLVDEYHWLRDKSNPDVIEYLAAENAYTEAMTTEVKPLAETLYREMLGRVKQSDLSVPSKRGDYFYYSRTEEGQQYPVHCRRKGSMDGPEEVLLDLNELAQGHTYLALGSFTVSDDDNLLAYASDTTGFRQYTLSVKNLRTGEVLSDTAERVTSVQWAADNKTLFFTTEDAVTKRFDRLWRHELAHHRATLCTKRPTKSCACISVALRDKKFLILQIHCADTSEMRVSGGQ